MLRAARQTLSLIKACSISIEHRVESGTVWNAFGTTSRSFSAAACTRHRAVAGHRKTLAVLSQPGHEAVVYQQSRAFSWAFWRKPETQSSGMGLEEPPVDVELVESIVEMAGPATMDASTWQAIYQATNWPHIWVAESLLSSAHDALGVSWMVALPLTVMVMRTVMAPMHIIAMREGHKMAKAAPLIQDAQKNMMLSMERGSSVQEAQNQYTKETQAIMATHKTGHFSALYPVFVQMPVFTGYYFALSMMCSHHLPSMVVDSAPFGFDLTVSDPFHLAPLACSGTIMLAMYLSMSHRWKMMAPEHQQMAKYGAFIAPPVLTAAFWTFPSALCYYWTCSNMYTIAMEIVLRHPGLRATVGLPSVAEQIELALDAQKRRASGGQVGLLDMYSRTADAANKQSATQAQTFMDSFKKDNAPAAGASPLAVPHKEEPERLKVSAATRFKRKGRG